MNFMTSFASLFIAVLLVTSVQAAPWPGYSKHSTHRSRPVGKRQIETYHPKSTFKTFGATGASFDGSQLLSKASIDNSARTYFKSLGFNDANIHFKSGYTSGSTRHAYVKQSYNDIPFSNAVGNVAFRDDKVVSYASSFIDLKSAKIAPSEPTFQWKDALPTLEKEFDAELPEDREPTLEYLVKSDGSVALTHVLQLRNPATGAAYEAFVCAHSGALLSVTDFVAHAAYSAVPIDKASFQDGIEIIEDPQDLTSSPFGWHNVSGQITNTTAGNNAVAFIPEVDMKLSANLTFTDVYSDKIEPTNATNPQAAINNAFFVVNSVHDVAYHYGFTEEAFNFQVDNFGKGGQGDDPVQITVHSSEGLNNAYMSTLPDGEAPSLVMFLFDISKPGRDGAMSNDVVIHEFTHGITNRLTGGGTARCLQTTEAGGMGEGWSDAVANWFQQSSEETRDMIMGSWLVNSTQGIRRFPYSVNATTNPLRYSSLKKDSEVHDIGETWANMLHNVYANLVAEFGFCPNRFTDPNGSSGNVVWMRLLMDSLALQPCNPTLVDSRDAWIQADLNRYNGTHKCTIFKAFASRGLGSKAGPTFDDDETVPEDCQ